MTKELPYPVNNGHRERSYHILKALSENNEVILVSPSGPGGEKEALEALSGYCRSILRVPEACGGLNTAGALLNIFSRQPYTVKSRYLRQFREAVGRVVRDERPDAVFCDGMHQSPNIPHLECAGVIGEHNIESELMRRYAGCQGNIIKKTYAYMEWVKMLSAEKKAWKRFGTHIVVSENDKEIMEKRCSGTRASVIPNGVDPNYYYPDKASEKPFSMIYTGQMDWHPNEDAVLYFVKEIYPLIKKRCPAAVFCIAGRNPTARIKDIAGSDGSVTVTGAVDDMRPFISESQVAVIPLRIGGGTRLKILQSLAMNTPVVTTGIGCEGLETEDGRHLVVRDTPEGFSRAVADLFTYPNLRRRLALEGRDLVERRYSWNMIEKQAAGLFSGRQI